MGAVQIPFVVSGEFLYKDRPPPKYIFHAIIVRDGHRVIIQHVILVGAFGNVRGLPIDCLADEEIDRLHRRIQEVASDAEPDHSRPQVWIDGTPYMSAPLGPKFHDSSGSRKPSAWHYLEEPADSERDDAWLIPIERWAKNRGFGVTVTRVQRRGQAECATILLHSAESGKPVSEAFDVQIEGARDLYLLADSGKKYVTVIDHRHFGGQFERIVPFLGDRTR